MNLRPFVLIRVDDEEFHMIEDRVLGIASDSLGCSAAWLEMSDEDYERTSKRSFSYFAGDDDKEYGCDRGAFKRQATKEEIDRLLPKCCKSFQERAEKLLNE